MSKIPINQSNSNFSLARTGEIAGAGVGAAGGGMIGVAGIVPTEFLKSESGRALLSDGRSPVYTSVSQGESGSVSSSSNSGSNASGSGEGMIGIAGLDGSGTNLVTDALMLKASTLSPLLLKNKDGLDLDLDLDLDLGEQKQEQPGIGQLGVAGLDRTAKAAIALEQNYAREIQSNELIGNNRNRVADRSAKLSGRKSFFFADFSYLVKPAPSSVKLTLNEHKNHEGERGSSQAQPKLIWREGREAFFGRANRRLPLLLDSAGYRRELSSTAPAWTKNLDIYAQAIELLQPDGYMSFDYPKNTLEDRKQSMRALDEMINLFPDDVANGRMWPVFSARWSFVPEARVSFEKLPGWVSRSWNTYIPISSTQKPFTTHKRESWARQAIAQALLLAQDADFLAMIKRFNRVALGGLVAFNGYKNGNEGGIARMVRHLYVGTLCQLFPETQFWLLGQASSAVVTGLGWLDLLGRVTTDGTWHILQATKCDAFATIERGIITDHQFAAGLDEDGDPLCQTTFTTNEMIAANLRSLISAYQGLIKWPKGLDLHLPLDQRDVEAMSALKKQFGLTQQELQLELFG